MEFTEYQVKRAARMRELSLRAVERYNEAWRRQEVVDQYRVATKGKSNAYANALIDEALALCGDPHYAVGYRKWGAEARAFLAKFC